MKRITALLVALVCGVVSSARAQVVTQGAGSTTFAWRVNFGGVSQPVTVGNTVTVTFTQPPLVASSALIGHIICDSGCGSAGVGQQVMAASAPVVIASDQSAVPVNVGNVPHVVVDTAPTTAVTNANLDIALSALRDALRGASSKTLTDVVTALTGLSVSISGAVAVTNASLDGTTLASLKTDLDKIPSQGQAIAAGSLPVVLPAAQVSTLTPLSSVTVTQPTGTSLHTVVDQNGTAVGASNPMQVSLANTGVSSNPVFVACTSGGGSCATSANLTSRTQQTQISDGAGNARSANVTASNELLVNVNNSVAVTNAGLSNIPAQGQALAAGSLPVVLPALQISALTPPAAITNFAIETGGNLAAIKTDVDKIPTQGQAVAGASMPVVLPAAQITTLTPPAAITNFANETGGNLAAIKTDVDKIPSQGQALAAGSLPVVLPALQISALTPPAAITNFAIETGGNLATIAANTDTRGALGSPTMVTAVNVDVTLLAANTNRVAWRVCNQATRSPLLVKFGSGATEFSYNIRVAPNSCYENTNYTGQVDGFWYASADNFAVVSESQ